MKLKTLLLSTLALSVLAGWLVYTESSNYGTVASATDDKLLVPPQNIAQTDEFAFFGSEKTTPLLRIAKSDEDYWFLPDYYQAPVAFDKLSEFSRKLLEMKQLRSFNPSETNKKELEIGTSTLQLIGKDKTTIQTIHFGRQSDRGFYLQPSESAPIVLTNAVPYWDTFAKNWVDRVIIPFEAGQFQWVSIQCPDETAPLVIERDVPLSPWKIISEVSVGESIIVKASVLNDTLQQLVSSRFLRIITDLSEERRTALLESTVWSIHLRTFSRDEAMIQLVRETVEPTSADAAEATTPSSPTFRYYAFYELKGSQFKWPADTIKMLAFEESVAVFNVIPKHSTDLWELGNSESVESVK
jgi:hypothetical protein